MPGTAAALGLDDPFDAAQAIDAQAQLMRDLLRRFASVPLALAAYNAGPAPVAAAAASRRTRRRAATSRASSGCSAARATPSAGGLAVRLVR